MCNPSNWSPHGVLPRFEHFILLEPSLSSQSYLFFARHQSNATATRGRRRGRGDDRGECNFLSKRKRRKAGEGRICASLGAAPLSSSFLWSRDERKVVSLPFVGGVYSNKIGLGAGLGNMGGEEACGRFVVVFWSIFILHFYAHPKKRIIAGEYQIPS